MSTNNLINTTAELGIYKAPPKITLSRSRVHATNFFNGLLESSFRFLPLSFYGELNKQNRYNMSVFVMISEPLFVKKGKK